MFVDSHCHIDGPEYDADRDDVIQRARDAGVSAILNVGTGDPNSGALKRAVELAEKHDDIYAAVGTHPHDARLFDARAEHTIKTLVKSSRVIAWGEIGLDYHYDNSPRELQRDVFRRQLHLARDVGLPVIIHTREAERDTIDILKSEWSASGLSFAGILTFKKADDLREVARHVPLDRLLIETDCPYLAPIPFRGQRNEPAHVVEVARGLAGIHGMDIERIGAITTKNFARLFGLELMV